MAKKFSQPSEGASVSRVDSGSGAGTSPVTRAAKDVKDGRYGKAAGETAGAAAGAYLGGEAGAKVGAEVGSRIGDKVDKKRDEKSDDKKSDDKKKDDKKNGQLDGASSLEEKEKNKQDEEEKKKKEKKESPVNRMRQLAQAMQLAQTGMHMLSLVHALMMLKLLLQMLMAAVQAAASSIFSVIMAIGHAIVTGIATVVSTIGAVATAFAGGVLAVAVSAVIAISVGSARDGDIASRDDGIADCNDDTSYMTAMSEASGNELENAKKVYAFFKAYGLSDINIAGILGNWSAESGIDSTSVETVFTERFIKPVEGTQKYEMWKGSYRHIVDTDEDGRYVWEETSPVMFKLAVCENGYDTRVGLVTYSGDILSKQKFVNHRASNPNTNYLGIGLGQWTNGRNLKLIEYADMFDEYEWYDLDLQLMFAIDPVNGDYRSYVNRLAGWTDEESATDAAIYFCEKWEGITYQEIRGTRAEEWLNTIATWQEGVDYDLVAAQSLIAAAGASGATAADRTGSRALRSCSGLRYADNTSAAVAAISFAWGPGEDYENDGTPCWQHLFDAMLPGDSYPRCCDRTVAVANWWSGTDTDYEYAGTGNQLKYLLASPRWEKIDWKGDKKNLLPGDVLIRNDAVIDMSQPGDTKLVHHTLMYVGNDLIKAKFGEEYNGLSSNGYEVVSGSIDEYSPHVGRWSNGINSGRYSSYYVFRNVEKYSNRPEWTDLTCVS